MFVNTQQVQIGITQYVEQEIAKQASGVNRYLYYLAVPRIGKIVEEYIQGYKNNAMVADLFDDNGNIDIDKLYNEAVDAMKKSGKFPLLGIWVSEDTLRTIYNYIVR
jgi:hypothetical protein